MIQLIKQGLERSAQVGEVHYPAGSRADRTANVNFDSKGVSMEPGALVAWGDVG